MTIMITYLFFRKDKRTGRRTRSSRAFLISFLALGAVLTLGGCTLFGGLFESVQVLAGGKAVSSYDYGAVEVGTSSQPVEFTIRNAGGLPLDFGGNSAISVTGSGASAFKVSGLSSSTVEGGNSVTFDVTFSPSGNGNSTATVTMQPLAGSPQSVTVTGYGGTGQIIVSDGSNLTTETQIAPGSTYDAGSGYYLAYPFYFYITNNSTQNGLTLDATPVTIDSPDGAFVMGSQPTSPVAANGGQSYVVIDLATANGDQSQHTATVTVGNSASGTFTFTIKAASSGMGS